MRTALLSAAIVVALSASPSFAKERAVGRDRPVSIAGAAAPAIPAVVANTNATTAPQGERTRTRAKSGRRVVSPLVSPVATPLALTAAVYDPIDSATLNAFRTETFGAVLAGDSFNDVFAFTLDADYLANSQVSTIDLSGIGVDFSSVLLDGFAFTQSATNPQSWTLDPGVSLLAGLHNIYVNGTIGTAGTGSYSGNINLTAAPGAVPEPGTWMMMLLGFGAAGYTIRRRPRLALAQMA